MSIAPPTRSLQYNHSASLRETQRVHRACHAMLKHYEAVCEAGKKADIRAAQRNILRSRDCAYSALIRAGASGSNQDRLELLFQSMRDGTASGHPISWWSKRKSDGTSRTIASLPLAIKARHWQLALLLRPLTPQLQAIFNLPGRSRDQLVCEVRDRLNNGFSHVARYDIRDCFPSINPEALRTLPLPRKEIEHYLIPDALTFVQRGATHDHHGDPSGKHSGSSHGAHTGTIRRPRGPRGLIQGSPASNAILAYLLQDLPPVGPDAEARTYGDDFIVVGRSADVCRNAGHTLAEHLLQCRYGPLDLRMLDDSEDGYFEALGYSFRCDAPGGCWSVDLSRKNYNKLDILHEQALFLDYQEGRKLPFRARAAVTEHLNSFASTSDPNSIVRAYLIRGAETLAPLENPRVACLRAIGFDAETAAKAVAALSAMNNERLLDDAFPFSRPRYTSG